MSEGIFDILNMLDEGVYVTDIDTYDLIYVNDKMLKNINFMGDYTKSKCYQLLQKRNTPCDFCSNARLRTDSFYERELTDTVNNHHFLMKGRLMHFYNRELRLEMAIDLTQKQKEKLEMEEKNTISSVLISCIHMLLSNTALDVAINAILDAVINYYESDSAFIYEARPYSNNFYCTHIRNPGCNLDMAEISIISKNNLKSFYKEISDGKTIAIDDIRTMWDKYPDEYLFMDRVNVKSVIIVPFVANNACVSFFGIGNPTRKKSAELATSLSYFITNEIMKRRLNDRIHYENQHDYLTGLRNRSSYMEFIGNFIASSVKSIGIIFLDINGLKRINDSKGHKAGDELIEAMACLIREAFDPYYTYRISGDEFVVICKDITENELHKRSLSLEKNANSFEEYYGIAQGIVYAIPPFDLEKLIAEADKKMYISKKGLER